MDRDRGFNFKLLVPPRVNNGQISAVRPQEIIDSCGEVNALHQGYSKGFQKEHSVLFSNTSLVAPTKPTRPEFPKMKVVLPMENNENNCSPGQLFSELLDEVEKIKRWKVNVDSDTVKKERIFHENKRTIETQRKAIQELQFENESLSVKLVEQISENEDLRNKNNNTRNLCNILKDTFQRSAEKMHLFETEREETHHLFMENSGSIQKLIAAFDSLRIQAEADQQQLLKVKEAMLHFEELKEKYQQEYNMKEDEVAALQSKIKDKENELQKLMLDLHETQQHCKQLQEATNEQHGLLKSSKNEQESLLDKLHAAEQRRKESEKNSEAIAAMLEQNKEEYAEMIQNKDLSLQELSRIKKQQAEKLKQNQATIQELQDSLALKIQRANNLEDKLAVNNKELERRNILLGESMERSAKKDEQIKVLEDELDRKSKSIESMKGDMDATEVRVEELIAELSRRAEDAQQLKNEAEIEKAQNDRLKKMLEAAENANKDFKEKSTVTETRVLNLEGQLLIETEKNKEHTFQMEQLMKDFTLHKVKYEELLSNFNELQCEKTAIQQQFECRSSNVKAIEENMKVSEKKALKLTRDIQRLEEENQCLRDKINSMKTKSQETAEIGENYEHLRVKITEKENQIKSMETKLRNLRKKCDVKHRAQEEYQEENKMLKKQIAEEKVTSVQLQNLINSLHEESQNLKRQNEENQQKLLNDLESKSAIAAELENELQKLRLTTAEAIKSREDTELKCQHQIVDMVALMEKHKSQYDRMVEEKDAELDENKKKETETAAHISSLELDLTKLKTDNDQLKQQLKTETTEKENAQKELTDLKKKMASMKITELLEARNKQTPVSNYQQWTCSETPKVISSKRCVFDFSKVRTTPSYSKDEGGSAVKKKAEIHGEDLKTPRSVKNQNGGTSKIKSYRIRTPPSAEKVARWGKSAIEFDLKSDSSDQNDLFTFVSATTPNAAPHCKLNIFKKTQSPVTQKSPGNSLKLAAVKRMRDAGWTAVMGCDKKKKITNDKIFA